jgi:DNA polymerase III delta prime subunit
MRPSDFLCKAAEQNKLSHAYLFSGNNHREKHALVERLLKILGVQSADYVSVGPAKEANAEISIAQMRELASFVSMSPWSSPVKLVLVEYAHAMNWEAQGAFLKVLEEPKGDTVFFLLTEYPELLFDTIRSRTQEYSFYSFAPSQVPEEKIAELKKLQHADLTTRFAKAKDMAETPEQIGETLNNWLGAARHLLRASLKDKENPSVTLSFFHAIKIIQETSMLLRTTNINPRLALERIMLNL